MRLFKVERNIIFAALTNEKSLLFKSTTTWSGFMNLTDPSLTAPLLSWLFFWRFQRKRITTMSPISWPEWRFPPSRYGDFLTPDRYDKHHRNICIYPFIRIYEFNCHIAGDHPVPSMLTIIIPSSLPSVPPSVKRRLILSADDNSAPISFHK